MQTARKTVFHLLIAEQADKAMEKQKRKQKKEQEKLTKNRGLKR